MAEMKEFKLDLLGYQRPVMKLYASNTIIDTGAIIPMTRIPSYVLERVWDAKLILDDAIISGIGGNKVKGQIYSLSNFKIGDIIFDKMEIFVCDKDTINFDILLSATLFYGTNYSFDMNDKNNQTLTVKIPKEESWHRTFEIKSLQGELYAQVDGILIQEDGPATNYIQTPILEDDDYELD